jgi:hypothetical protein
MSEEEKAYFAQRYWYLCPHLLEWVHRPSGLSQYDLHDLIEFVEGRREYF